ncbi:MAG: sigma-70 family RNA polymerase sigma factor [Bacteroidales bacterium]|jgi:RNA polymerase sigma-70 factor (ECF subfamily)|nr:sigma-70 family RNA polymerase sigma factor [Bacteroidales bacterium]
MNRCELSDQELVHRYHSGDEASLSILISRHRSRVFSYLLMVVKDRHLAEDLFQDTFIKVINTIKSGSYKEEGKFIQWVMRIAHNLTIDHFRRQKRFPTVEAGENQDIFETLNMMDPSVEDRMVTDQIHRDVRKLIEYLPAEQREVLMMRHYGDLSFKEIADQTDVSINTALGRMRYALINLRKLVSQHHVILTS